MTERQDAESLDEATEGPNADELEGDELDFGPGG